MGHIERRLKEKEELKQHIIDAAKKIAIKDGWNSVTIRKIAEEIDYTPPIVYEYFENKETLIKEIVIMGFEQLTKDSKNLHKTELDPKKLLLSLSIMHWDFAFENKELYQLMFNLEKPVKSPEMKENIALIEKAFLKLIKDKDSLHEVLFSWMCLMQGAISFVMKFPDLLQEKGKEPRVTFINSIKRYLDGLK